MNKEPEYKVNASARLENARKKYKNPHIKKIYDLSKLPDHDKLKLRPYQNKFDFVNSMPAHIQLLSAAYNIYFVTFTFKKNQHSNFYQEYFYLVRRKIDSLLNIRKHHDDKVTQLILIPESRPMLHYHGFLLIHKSKSEKFSKSCVKNVKSEFVQKENDYKDVVYLKDEILNLAYRELKHLHDALAKEEIRLKKEQPKKRKTFPLKHLRILLAKDAAERKMHFLKQSISSYKIYPITDVTDFFAAQMYSSKDFISNRCFSVDDVIFEAKPMSKTNCPI